MGSPDRHALILLAAGLSSRFGDQDKLAQPLRGLPLGLHLAARLQDMPFAARFVVTRPDCALPFEAYGLDRIVNPDPARGLGHSIRLGITGALRADPDAVLIALADMPLVSATHVAAIRAAAEGAGAEALVASAANGIARPPALFGRALFAKLLALDGDQGARALLRAARLIEAPANELVDVDLPEDLLALEQGRFDAAG